MRTGASRRPRPGVAGRRLRATGSEARATTLPSAARSAPWIAVVAAGLVAACGDPGGAAGPVVPAGRQADTAVSVPAANSTGTGVCGRTPQVSDALVAATGRTKCADVTVADLETVFFLDLTGSDESAAPPKIAALRSGDFQGLTNLGVLLLRANQIQVLPPDVFSGLSKLNTLDLAENRLDALPEGVLRGLVALWTLSLAENRLTELPADAFEGLAALTSLDLSYNELRVLPPGVFDHLGSLEFLQLSANRLEDLPDGAFGGASALADLQLDGNRLAQWPAAAFRGLPALQSLWMGGNQLRSAPAGALESLGALRRLDLSRNLLPSLPAGFFRGAAGLEMLWLDGNPGAPFVLEAKLERIGDPDPAGNARIRATVVEGAPFDLRVPLRVTGGDLSAPVAVIAAGAAASGEIAARNAVGSSLAVTPLPPAIPGGDACDASACATGLQPAAGDPLVLVDPPTARLSVPTVHLVQSTQSLDGRTPLVAGRQALLRVFATTDSANSFRPSARATFFVNGQAAHAISLETPAAGIPTDAPQGRLARTFNATVPGSALRPGVEMVVELDPERALPLAPGSVRRIPAEGRAVLDVRRVPPLKLTVVPIHFAWEPNAATNAPVAAVAREFATGRSDERLRFVRALLPVAEVEVKVREPYFSVADTTELGAIALLEEVQLLRHVEAGGTDEHYHGIFARPRFVHRQGFWRFLGVAFQPGYSGLTLSHAGDGAVHPELELTLAHEIGHNMSLGHAPCGRPEGVDEHFPYQEASVGQWGFEFAGPAWPERLVDPARHVDLMSYCRPYWISDYNFSKAMRFRAERASPASSRAVRSILLRGGARDGRLRLEPALVWNAPPKLPSRPGAYTLAGLGADGSEIFSFSFEPDALNHGGGRSFLFAVPMRAGWETALEGFALHGPEGVATVEVEASRGLAVFTYPGDEDRAARIRGIAREWGGALPAGLDAAGAVDVRFGWPARE